MVPGMAAVSAFGAARFTAEIVWPLAVRALEIFTSSAKPLLLATCDRERKRAGTGGGGAGRAWHLG
jgi:hypothetical protein